MPDEKNGITADFGAEASATGREQVERMRRNASWLGDNWPSLLPQARGKYVAVAARVAFIADTAEEAWAWAARTHPEDDGAIVQYVRGLSGGIRVYAHRRHLAPR